LLSRSNNKVRQEKETVHDFVTNYRCLVLL
jgi:hypothetical protein